MLFVGEHIFVTRVYARISTPRARVLSLLLSAVIIITVWFLHAYLMFNPTRSSALVYYSTLYGATFLAPFITFILLAPPRVLIRHVWKVGVLTFIVSFIVENGGVLPGFWRFSVPSLFPAPLIVTASFGWGGMTLLWIASWAQKATRVRTVLVGVGLVVLAIIGTVTDWTNPHWIASSMFHPSYTFIIWLVVVGIPLWYAYYICSKTAKKRR